MSNLPSEPEFEQAYKELASTLENSSLFQKNPEYKTALKIAAVPERVIQFRVVWEDDKNQVQVNRGYRVQFNSALGPYKGGLRFHPTVNLSILKFLGFEQIFKNALTGINIGGGKGGADFDPKGKSDNEIRKFCVSFMRELSKHIGADTDVPAGDIGVSPREIGWLFGAYKAQKGLWEGCLTGKGGTWGGSLIRPEATGYGLVYYVQHMIQYASGGKESFQGKRVAISGSGNVAQYAALKAIELGATILSLSDSKGTIVSTSEKGIQPEEVEYIAKLKVDRKQLTVLTEEENYKSKFKYIEGARPWTQVGKVDVALPSATQNEVSGDEAKALIDAGAKFIAEGSNMGCSQDAIDIFEAHRKENKGDAIWYAPGKAANAGGVAVSGLEMAQNSQRISWTSEEVDAKLKGIMESCFKDGLETAKEYVEPAEGEFPSLVAGSNIAGFSKLFYSLDSFSLEYVMSFASGGRIHIEVTSSLLALTIITVLFRLLARRRAKLHIGIDDWTLLVALALVFSTYIVGLVWVLFGGVGKHVAELSPSEVTVLLKCYLICWISYAATFAVTKVSILLLYVRIFPVRSLRIACAIVGTLVIAVGIALFTIGFVQCRPFEYIWDKTLPGDTIRTWAILVISEPCVAIISICLPTTLPVLRDIASYTTIEYKKALCRITTVLEEIRPSSEQVTMEVSETRSNVPLHTPQLGIRHAPADEIIEVSSEYEDGDESTFPTKPIFIGGRMMSV
ncbi:MAG: hypothetical protein Q9216_006349 [Gyalolechia sp. 2 TL-2023]